MLPLNKNYYMNREERKKKEKEIMVFTQREKEIIYFIWIGKN